MRVLNLDILQNGLPGITPANGAFMMEAAVVGLFLAGHRSGTILTVEGDFDEKIELQWSHEIDGNTLSSWTVSIEMVEYGAVGIALLLMQELTEYNVFEKSQLGTGIDFWMGNSDLSKQLKPLFLRKARLEITGIEKENRFNNLNVRISDKKRQVKKTDYTGLPVYIFAIEFDTPKSKIIIK